MLVGIPLLAFGCRSATEAGARATREGTGYKLTLAHGAVTPGEPATASVRVVPRAGFKVNTNYPRTRLDFAAGAGVEVRPSFDVGAAAAHSESELRFAVPFKLRAGGGATGVGVRFKFSVCNDTECLTPLEEFRWDPSTAR